MSAENVELVRFSFEAFGRGDFDQIDVSETYAVLVEGGRIKRVGEYRTVEQALEAVGPALQ